MTALHADSLFLSHGSPMTVLEATAATAFLAELGRRMPRPRAVVAASAHWTTAAPKVGGAARPRTIHDFSGFPPELYRITYPAPGAPDLADRVRNLLGEEAAIAPERGLDHGIWSVASLMWPGADIPIVPLSVQPARDPAWHYELGRRLRPLAEEGILVLATGSATHNLHAYAGAGSVEDAPPAWVTGFADWLADAVTRGDVDALLEYRARAPYAEANHPTDEHLLPLFVALGASRRGEGECLHRSVEYGVIAMDAYGFR